MSKFTKYSIKDSELAEKKLEIEEFVRAATQSKINQTNQIDQTITQKIQPWVSLDDIEKTKSFNLRVTKADIAKLQYISQNTPYSMQAFCYECIKNAITQKIEELNC